MDIEDGGKKKGKRLRVWDRIKRSRSPSPATSKNITAVSSATTTSQAELPPGLSNNSLFSPTSPSSRSYQPSMSSITSQFSKIGSTIPSSAPAPPPKSQSLSAYTEAQCRTLPTGNLPKLQITSDVSKISPAQYSDLWSRAFDKANDATRTWIKNHELDLNPSGTVQLKDQVEELIRLMESKKLLEQNDEPFKIEIANRKIILQEYITDAIAFITMAGDAAILFAPPQASAPWAVAKAIMKIPVKHIEQKAALFGTVEWFTRITRRGQIYEDLYTTETTDGRAVSNLREVLLQLYIAAIELLAKFDSMNESGVVRKTWEAILNANYATDLISNIPKIEQELDKEVQACEASRFATSSARIHDGMQVLKNQLDQLSSPLPRIDKSVSRLLEKINERELEELMNFISSEMFGKSHAAVMDKRTANTGDWLLANRDFRAWQDVPSSSGVFLLKGVSGTGKTYLTSKVLDHLKQILEATQHDEGFAYFYCSRSGSLMQEPLIVLRSFVRQLSGKAFDDSGHIQSSLVQRCVKAKKEGRSLSYKDCEESILESLNLYSKSTIILDALDESDVARYNLAKILIQMMEKSKRPVKIFISSRPDREYLEEVFKDKFLIALDAKNQNDDIEKFLIDKLYSTERFKQRRQGTQDKIRDVFKTRSCGMFRWAHLQVSSLERCISDDAVHSWARKLPRDLTGAYDQLWENVKDRDESDVALAERAIMWVLSPDRPLEVEVLLEAIQYAVEGSTVVRKEKQTRQQILSLCQDLLTIDEARGVWMLPHASVAEYFDSKGWTGWKCDAFASKVCLGFLKNFYPDISQHYGFTYYVYQNWHKHVRRYDNWLGSKKEQEADPDLTAALKRFLGSPNESSKSYREWAENRGNMSPTNMALFSMCRFGFYYTLRDWWLEGKITEEMALQKLDNMNPMSSLGLAIGCESIPICRRLIELIDVMHPDAERHTGALMDAVEHKNDSILKLLVVEGNADVNSPCRERGGFRTAAQSAAMGRPEILQWMLDRGIVDLERETGPNAWYGNLLITAASGGRIESIKILLKAGAKVNAAVKTGWVGSALAAAANWGELEPVRLLLDGGADPNLPLIGGIHGSALEASAATEWLQRFEESRRVMQLMLLDAGANPAAVLDRGAHGSALAAAAFYGRKEILKAMVDRVGTEIAIETLRQSRHPDKKLFHDQGDVRRWKDIATYLAEEVGVSKDVLHTIGLWDIQHVSIDTEGDMEIRFSDFV